MSLPALYQMMGYLGQDFVDDYGTPKAAIDAYLEGFPVESINQALLELRELLARDMSEDELDHYLGRELDCAYNMAADGLKPSQWLRMVAKQIENGLEKKLSR